MASDNVTCFNRATQRLRANKDVVGVLTLLNESIKLWHNPANIKNSEGSLLGYGFFAGVKNLCFHSRAWLPDVKVFHPGLKKLRKDVEDSGSKDEAIRVIKEFLYNRGRTSDLARSLQQCMVQTFRGASGWGREATQLEEATLYQRNTTVYVWGRPGAHFPVGTTARINRPSNVGTHRAHGGGMSSAVAVYSDTNAKRWLPVTIKAEDTDVWKKGEDTVVFDTAFNL